MERKGPPLAARDPLVKATATLGLLLILLGLMQWKWSNDAHSITLPTSKEPWLYVLSLGDSEVRISGTQIIGIVFPILLTIGTTIFLRVTKVGTAMRALANDLETVFVPTGGDDALFGQHASRYRQVLDGVLASPPTQCETLAAAMRQVGGECKACHQDFRG